MGEEDQKLTARTTDLSLEASGQIAAACTTGGERLIDTAFVAEHTHGFEAFADFVRSKGWDELERYSGLMRLITMRSNDQFNTTIYGYDDRFRGVKGTRMVLFMNRADIARLGLRDAQTVDLVGAASDGIAREVTGFRVLAYDIPLGCLGGYYPECNPLIPLWHHAERSKVPAAKSVPVRIRAA